MQYFFDIENFDFKKATTSLSKRLWRVFWLILSSFALSVVLYALLSMVVNTNAERELVRENRMYERLYPEMLQRQTLVGDVTGALQERDNEIYGQIFNAAAPSLDPVSSVDLTLFSEETSEESKVSRSAQRLQQLSTGAGIVEDNFREIFEMLSEKALDNMPLTMPLSDVTYAQTGASVGQKYNPFYKVEAAHEGLDIVAGQGDAVFATAQGQVSEVQRSRKGLGNVVTIDHGNGYVTRYAHLGDILVSKGQTVAKGRKIGTVGISGNTFAPHLHYELIRDGIPQDPVNYMFATLSPGEYTSVAFMSSRTGQSLD